MSAFTKALVAGEPLLMDGAMGTQLIERGFDAGRGLEQLNVLAPQVVLSIHRGYVAAGARVLLTNTFEANVHGDSASLEHICRAGVALAREAAAGQGFVVGDLAPTARSDEQLEAILSCFEDTDAVLVETASSFELLDSVLRLREAAGTKRLPILFSATFQKTGGTVQTHGGLSPVEVARQASGRHIAALGVNCGQDISVEDVIQIVRDYRTQTGLPVFARPNAGQPRQVGGRWTYPITPQQMAAAGPALRNAGVAMLGGCCGTTPEHIAACAARLLSKQ